MEHPLDNPAWNALETGNAQFAVGNGDVKYFHPEVSPFAALRENTIENLQKLYEIAPAPSVFGVVTPVEISIPEPWELITRMDCLQMVCNKPARQVNSKDALVTLTEEQVPAMLELTKLTNPGPFARRTIEYGHYRGIFEGGQLVAMAGQRMNPKPYAEVSAVCTHPDHVGKGYAARLIMYQVERIIAAGEIPFLHVLAQNERAVKLYGSLGFKTRGRMLFYVVKKAG